MFEEWLKIACIIGLPLFLIACLIGSWQSIIPLLLIVGVLSSAFGTGKGLAQAEQNRNRRYQQRRTRR